MNWVRKRYFILLVVPYLVGLAGFFIPQTRTLFMQLTPLMLAYSFFLVVAEEWTWLKKRWYHMVIVFTVGILAEIIGVNTGYLFGDYAYGSAVGPKLLGVPILIGTNWVMLSVAAFSISAQIFNHRFLIALLTGALITAFDMLLEPVAIKYGWWTWNSVDVPAFNYVCWLILGILFGFLLYNKSIKTNRSFYMLIIQALFFMVLLNLEL
jgi:putative membrane protein